MSGASDTVASYVRAAIADGRFISGDRIDLAWLAEQLRVSRTPVREALVQLESEGLLESLPSRATIVRRMSMRQIEELFAARIPIEGTLAAVGARQLSDADLAILAELIEKIMKQDDIEQAAQLIALHVRFLYVLYGAARSDRLMQLARPLVVQGTAIARQFSYPDREQMRESGQTQYVEIFQACEARDGQAAESRLRSLLVDTAAALLGLERSADEVEYLPSVLRPAELRAFRASLASGRRRARRTGL